MNSNIRSIVTQPSIAIGEPITIAFSSDLPIPHGNVGWCVARVRPDETEFIMASCGVTVSAEQGAIVDCVLAHIFEPDIYTLRHTQIFPEGAPLGPYNDVLHIFEVRAPGSSPRDINVIMEDYDRILRLREASFQRSIGVGTNAYEIFVFVKNCLLTMSIRLDHCEVVPMNRLGAHDEISAIKDFFGIENVVIKEWAEYSSANSFGEHAFAVHFPNVRGDTYREAMNIATQEVALLAALYSLKRGGAGELFGCHIIDRATGESWADVFNHSYRGNILGGFLSGESPKEIKLAMEKLQRSETLRLYVELFREARRERNLDVEVFRYWNLLESIARSKNFVGVQKRSWEGKVLHNKKGVPIKVQDHAMELVFELLRQAFASTSSEADLLWGPARGTLTDKLIIWYRRRNCVVHGGDCLCRNIGAPRTEAEYLKCNDEKQKAIALGDDISLRELRGITERIINIEIYN